VGGEGRGSSRVIYEQVRNVNNENAISMNPSARARLGGSPIEVKGHVAEKYERREICTPN